MSTKDLDYYRKRAAAERNHAQAASEPAIAAIHDEMARMYERLLVLHAKQPSKDGGGSRQSRAGPARSEAEPGGVGDQQ